MIMKIVLKFAISLSSFQYAKVITKFQKLNDVHGLSRRCKTVHDRSSVNIL